MTEAECGYAAGIVDGEGYLGVNRTISKGGQYNYQVNCTVVNTNRELLEFLHKRWGGSIHDKLISSFGKRQVWQWRISSQLADKFVTVIYPHLLVKKEQAKLLRTFQELVRQQKHQPRSEAYKEMQARIHAKVKKLNARRPEIVPHADSGVQASGSESASGPPRGL